MQKYSYVYMKLHVLIKPVLKYWRKPQIPSWGHKRRNGKENRSFNMLAWICM